MSKHLHPQTATAKGHLAQSRQNLQSTKTKPVDEKIYLDNIRKNIKALIASGKTDSSQSLEDIIRASMHKYCFPPSDSPNIKQNEVLYLLVDSSPSSLSYIDLTGRFPYRSDQGNEYVLVAYYYDANAILAQPLKNRQAASITKAWEKINANFEFAAVKPATCIIDNEASHDLKTALSKNDIKHQLVPPHCH